MHAAGRCIGTLLLLLLLLLLYDYYFCLVGGHSGRYTLAVRSSSGTCFFELGHLKIGGYGPLPPVGLNTWGAGRYKSWVPLKQQASNYY